MCTPLRFAKALEYSKLFASVLDELTENGFEDILFDELLIWIKPILINGIKCNHASIKYNIKSLLKSLIFSCLINIHNTQKHKNEFPINKELIDSMENIKKIQILKQTEISNKKIKPIFKYFSKIKSYSVSCIDILPDELLSKSMSFIDAVELAQIEVTSHKFLQCARRPTAISHLTQKFFDTIYQNHTRCPIQRYSNLKNIHINKDILIYIRNKPKYSFSTHSKEWSYHDLLSWLHLNEASLKSLMSITLSIVQKSVFMDDYDMNELRGLRYIENVDKCDTLSLHSEHYTSSMFNNNLLWKNIHDIKRAINRFPKIEASLAKNTYFDLETGFLWMAIFCHENMEELFIRYKESETNRNVILYNIHNYINIIPNLPKLKFLKIDAWHDTNDELIDNDKVLKEGKEFFRVLLFKIKCNTLERLEINYWYNTWCSLNVDVFKDLILKHYKTLNNIIFYQDDEFNEYRIFDMEVWEPIISFYHLIQNKNKYQEIDYWLNNTLKTFQFFMTLESFKWSGYEICELKNYYMIQFEKRKIELMKIKRMINECIKYCKEKKIECIIKVNCQYQYHVKFDPYPMYTELFIDADTHNNYMINFDDSFFETQPLITTYFPKKS